MLREMEGSLQRSLGANLRSLRMTKGMSQEAFADVFKFHRTYLGSVERGERNLSLRSIERLAEHLGVDPIRLLVAPATERATPATANGRDAPEGPLPRRRTGG